MELSYKAIRELGQKYHVPMDWSGYVESTSTDALTTSSMQKLTSDTTSDTQDSEATSSLNISVDPSDTTNTDVLICIWDRCSRGPEVISYLDQPSYQTIKGKGTLLHSTSYRAHVSTSLAAYSGRTSINKLLMDLEDDGRFLFRRRYQCYSLRDQEHDYTDPALRWSPKDETRRIASLPKLKGFTTIHIIQDVNFFLLFILHVQPSQPARGIVVGMKNEKDAYVVEEYLLQGLRLTKGEFHYQEIKGDHRLQLTGCQLEPFSCDWCILHGRPNLDS
ncbi:hypothetical protein FRC03_002249 [Tulasnella sp. 419]|nr:hypothetical protein FRC03_002249 [Tulasnella sp. 419]